MTQDYRSEITAHITAHAQQYFPSFHGQTIHVSHDATIERPQSILLRYTISNNHEAHHILAKIFHTGNESTPVSVRPRRFVVKPEEKYWLAANTLTQVESLFRQRNDPRFGFIQVLDKLPESQTIVMTELSAPDLRRYFLKKNRFRFSSNTDSHLRIFHNVGKWLRIFHSLKIDDYVEECYGQPASFLEGAKLMTDFLRTNIGREAYFDNMMNTLGRYPSAIFKNGIPMGRMHGDFALRNILMDADYRITVIDTLGKWQTPIYEDIAYFLIRLWTNQLQVFTLGTAYRSEWIEECEDVFLKGYFGDQSIPEETITWYKVMALLDQWASLTEILGSTQKRPDYKLRFHLTRYYFQRLLNQYISRLD